MTGSIRIFEKSNFTPKLGVLVFLKFKLPNMTDWHRNTIFTLNACAEKHDRNEGGKFSIRPECR